MKTTGILSIIFHIIFLAFACMMFGVSFAGFTGETLMIIAAVISLLVWGTFIALTIYAITLAVAMVRENSSKRDTCLAWSSKLFFTFAILSIGSAWVIGLGYFSACGPAWLASLFHWAGLAGSVIGFAVWFLYRYIVRGSIGSSAGDYSRPMGWRRPLITGSVTYGLWAIIWLVLWIWLSGSINTSLYPARASSPYKLPYPDGTSAWVVQGNNSRKNHTGSQQFAWDFRLSCGTPVVATRDGNVRAGFVDSHTGYGTSSPNNFVEVEHSDGTIARYVHIEQNSVSVTAHQHVNQGQKLAEVGNVGNSMTGHIHFQVNRSGNSIAISFQDVDDDNGIPRAFKSYTSGN
jgi:hypothetical protein